MPGVVTLVVATAAIAALGLLVLVVTVLFGPVRRWVYRHKAVRAPSEPMLGATATVGRPRGGAAVAEWATRRRAAVAVRVLPRLALLYRRLQRTGLPLLATATASWDRAWARTQVGSRQAWHRARETASRAAEEARPRWREVRRQVPRRSRLWWRRTALPAWDRTRQRAAAVVTVQALGDRPAPRHRV